MENVYVLCLMLDGEDSEVIKPIRVFSDMEQVGFYVKNHFLHSKTRAYRIPFGPEIPIDPDVIPDLHY